MCATSSTRKGCWENETLFRVSAGSYLRPQIRLTGNPKLYNSMGIPWETLDETSQIFIDFFHTKMKGVKIMGIIYCFTNKINQKKYIGQTINPEQRYNAHKSNYKNIKNKEYNSLLHRAFRKYGFNNFTYEVLVKNIDDINILNKLEIYYIKHFNTKIPNGYNIESGGKNSSKPKTLEHRKKEIWGQAKLNEQEIIELRKAYANKESPTKIYNEKYKDRIHYNSFLNIWSGRRYSLIMPEVFEKGRHTKLTKEIVKKIREDREKTNLSYTKLAQKYNISKSTVADVITKRTWKDV